MIAKIDQANAAFLAAMMNGLNEVGAVLSGKGAILPRLKAICPEFEINKYNIEGEIIFISNGCHLFSEKGAKNREEFVVGLVQSDQISIQILNLVCFFHASARSIKIGDVLELGLVDGLDQKLSHVLISHADFFSQDIVSIERFGYVYNLLWVLPISGREYNFIQNNGVDLFQEKLESSGYDFFDIRDNYDYLD